MPVVLGGPGKLGVGGIQGQNKPVSVRNKVRSLDQSHILLPVFVFVSNFFFFCPFTHIFKFKKKTKKTLKEKGNNMSALESTHTDKVVKHSNLFLIAAKDLKLCRILEYPSKKKSNLKTLN